MAIGDRIPLISTATQSIVNTATNTSTETRIQTVNPPATVATDPKDVLTLFDGNKLYADGLITGDIKDSIRTADHNGWVLLNGRAKSTLTATQQAVATALGIGTNLPDGRNRLTMGASSTRAVGTVGGDNTIARNNLPNTNITSGNESQSHTHAVDPASVTTSKTFDDGKVPQWASSGNNFATYKVALSTATSNVIYAIGRSNDQTIESTPLGHTHTVDIPSTTSGSNNQTHTHTIPLNGGVTQVDFVPEYLALNKFIYLGE